MQLSENYRRGVTERKEWLKAHPGATWEDATDAYKAKRLTETSSQRTPVAETTPPPAPEAVAVEPATPLHKMSSADFASHAAQVWTGVFEDLNNRRPGRAPFFAGWNTGSVVTGDRR